MIFVSTEIYKKKSSIFEFCLGDDEETLDYIESEMSKAGITQDLIDETRAATETKMLKDLQEISNRGEDLEMPDKNGATPVCIFVS
jgi:protein phosphatase 1 regulatory subunit 16A